MFIKLHTHGYRIKIYAKRSRIIRVWPGYIPPLSPHYNRLAFRNERAQYLTHELLSFFTIPRYLDFVKCGHRIPQKDFQIFKNFRAHIYRGVGVCVNGDTPRGVGTCSSRSCSATLSPATVPPTPCTTHATAAGCIALCRG